MNWFFAHFSQSMAVLAVAALALTASVAYPQQAKDGVELDPAKREALYQDFQKIVVAHAPIDEMRR